MVSVRISETYDLGTRINKIGLIGIHTPSTATIKRLYPGLWESYKFFKLKKCDVTIACASMLPADPLQVGTEAGSIAPQDMFNPILYRAVTNETFDIIMSRIYQGQSQFNADGHNTAVFPDAFANLNDVADIYYSLLSERGWRKSMPQAGLSMRGLVPLVYNVVTAYGNTVQPNGAGALDRVGIVQADGGVALGTNESAVFRGRATRMPRLPTKRLTNTDTFTASDTSVVNTFVACICMPPSKLHSLYYRLRVSWTVEFSQVRSANEIGSVLDVLYNQPYVYYDGTNFESSKAEKDLETNESMISTNDMETERIMQSGM